MRTNVVLVGVRRTERQANGRERKPWEEKMVKAEELRNATGIRTELFGLPTYSQASLGHEGLREWAEGGRGKVEKKEGKFCDILIRESREQTGDLETLNSSCLLKSRTLFFIFYSVPQPLVHLFFPFF